MESNIKFKNLKVLNFLLWGIVFSAFASLYNNAEKILSNKVTINYELSKINNKWLFKTKELDPALYYVSLGRPRGNCKLSLNNNVVNNSLNSNSGYRRSFSLDGAIRINSRKAIQGVIECEKSEGFATGLSHQPLIAKYKTGAFFHFWRLFNVMALGPISSFVLLLFSIYYFFTELKINPKTNNEWYRNRGAGDFILVAFVATLYSLSLSHLTRIFLSDFSATIFHIGLRTLFSFALLNLATKYIGFQRFNMVIHFLLVSFFIIVSIKEPTHIEYWYDKTLVLFPGMTLAVFILLLFEEPRNKEVILFKILFSCWATSQFFDLVKVHTGIGVFSAPTIIMATSILLCLIIYSKFNILRNTNSLSSSIAESLNLGLPFQKLLSEISYNTLFFSSFTKVSCYIDSFVTGETQAHGEKLLRVFDYGYKEDISSTETVYPKEGKGIKMVETAPSIKEITLHQNPDDGTWYSILKLGNSLYLNLSSDSNLNSAKMIESKEIIEGALPVLNRVGDFVDKSKEIEKGGLELLRFHYPEGLSEEYMLVVFADINNYSSMLLNSGFQKFLHEVYQPAMFRAISGSFFSEVRDGDDMFLMAPLKDTSEFENKLLLFMEFIENEGAKLCINNGFPAVSFKITVGHSLIQIGISKTSINIMGDGINMTSRISSSATRYKTPILQSMISEINLKHFEVIGPIDVVKKNDFLKMCYLMKKAS